MPTIVEMIERLGALVIDNVIALGNFVLFLVTALWCAVTPPYKLRLTIRQMRTIGAESIVLVALIGAFTGMVLGLQGYNTLR
ncbi:MAG: ABC transporter permease, partial [Candidatus Binataceae bacterium]|nr:ABC transporter permease [Candidatus Binataceae bacterium]